MSVLSDRDIRAAIEAGEVVIKPYDPQDLQPSAVDLHLDRRCRGCRNNRSAYIVVRSPQPDLTARLSVADVEPLLGFAAGATYQLHPRVRFGGEAWGAFEDTEVAVSAGPSLSLASASNIWIAVTAGFGLSDTDKFAVRAIVGIEL